MGLCFHLGLKIASQTIEVNLFFLSSLEFRIELQTELEKEMIRGKGDCVCLCLCMYVCVCMH